MKLRGTVFALCFAGALALAACGSVIDSPACTADYRYGLTVTVVDSINGAAPASALLLARSGFYSDSVGPYPPQQMLPGAPPELRLSAAGERAGTYAVTVRSQGYRDWVLTGVRVTADQCHVHPVALTARMQR
jgi:hypothetical protein